MSFITTFCRVTCFKDWQLAAPLRRALEHFTSLMSVISLYDDKQVSWLISFLRVCCVCRMVNSASIMKKEKVFISILFWLLICFSYSEGKDSLYFEFARVLLVRVHFSGATAFFFGISAIKRFSVWLTKKLWFVEKLKTKSI